MRRAHGLELRWPEPPAATHENMWSMRRLISIKKSRIALDKEKTILRMLSPPTGRTPWRGNRIVCAVRVPGVDSRVESFP